MGDTKSNVYLPALREQLASDPFCSVDRSRKTLNGISADTRGPVGMNGDKAERTMYWSSSSRFAWCPSRSNSTYQNNDFLAERDMLLMLRKKSSFALMVLKGKGKLEVSIRKWLGDNDHYWQDIGFGFGVGKTGHGYLSLNSLGPLPNQTPKSVMQVIGRNINELFPWGGNTGGDKKSIKLGDTFKLPPFGSNEVQVVYVCDDFFVLQTTRHVLVGVAIHGVCQDAAGELWMFQEGWGEPAEPAFWGLFDEYRDAPGKILFNYKVAERMWMQFARQTRKKVLGGANTGK